MRLTYDHLYSTDPEYHQLLLETEQLLGKRVYPFGSRYVLGPDYPRGDTDILLEAVDSLFGAPDQACVDRIMAEGFKPHISHGYAGMHIASYRKDDINLVVMTDQWEFYARCACVELCRAQGTHSKADRRDIHKLIADVERVGADMAALD